MVRSVLGASRREKPRRSRFQRDNRWLPKRESGPVDGVVVFRLDRFDPEEEESGSEFGVVSGGGGAADDMIEAWGVKALYIPRIARA